MKLPDFLEKPPDWVQGAKGQGIILSSRVRLARNLTNMPFPPHSVVGDRRKVISKVRKALTKLSPAPEFLPLEELSQIEHGFLLERRLIPFQMLKEFKASAVAVWQDSGVSIIVNEEDHLRLQAITPGMMIDQAYQLVHSLDKELRRHLPLARTQELGYLTSCPTNLGTGMRVSLFCHLPGMALSGQIEKTLGSMIPSGIAVRGFFGESSPFLGNIFQISNQITLGITEDIIISRVKSICEALIKGEREARKELLHNVKIEVMDRVCRAFGVLSQVRTLEFPELVGMLSDIRLGLDLKWIKGITHRRINQLMMITQPAHLCQIERRVLPEPEMNVKRADLLRDTFKKAELIEALES
jgi:protein arginine kinase